MTLYISQEIFDKAPDRKPVKRFSPTNKKDIPENSGHTPNCPPHFCKFPLYESKRDACIFCDEPRPK